MNESEVAFVNTFIAKDKRERWLTLLASEKGRAKQVDRLAHVFDKDLDPRFSYDKDTPPPNVAAEVQKLLLRWTGPNSKERCYVIANNSEVDGTVMRLTEAEQDERLTFGAIIILIPDKLAFYHTERSNNNHQPYYLLYRP